MPNRRAINSYYALRAVVKKFKICKTFYILTHPYNKLVLLFSHFSDRN